MPCAFTVASPGSALSNAVAANIVSQVLMPGTYLVWGQVNYILSAATATEARCAVSVSSATMPSQAGGGGLGPDALCILPLTVSLLTNTLSVSINATTLVLVAPTSIYLCAQATFSLGTISAYGTLFAIAISGASYNLIPS